MCTSILAAASSLVGCASTPQQPENKAIRQMLETEIGDMDQSFAEKIMTQLPPKRSANRRMIESEINRKVWWWMRYYTVRERKLYNRALTRGEHFKPLVLQILREKGLPQELYYLAFIESGFVQNATSHASAKGIWQFMRPTALHYGLGVGGGLDERLHPIAATYAAAKYLNDLHRQFDSWYLAIAAYNAGQGRIARAVRRGKSRDFWSLAERGYLPKETMDYIPKFIAATTIGNHLDEFGFAPAVSNVRWPEVASVDIKPNTRLNTIARHSGMTVQELLRFNPQLKQALAHPGMRRIRLWLPQEAAIRIFARKTMLASSKGSAFRDTL